MNEGQRVLITGKDSYIGNHIMQWFEKSGIRTDVISAIKEEGELDRTDFSKYDTVIHVAGIVHRKDINDWRIYKSVNVDLAFEVAQKAKSSGVKQFVFFSTMGVYPGEKTLPKGTVFGCDTPLDPEKCGFYGKSKLLAEEKIKTLEGEDFCVAIVRPPNVYGKGCRGGYISGFTTIVNKLPVIPIAYEDVKQSMIYIDNLCECCRLIVLNQVSGVFMPQDDRIPSAVELMRGIARGLGKKKIFLPGFGWLLRLVEKVPVVVKGYGGIAYSPELSNAFDNRYVVVPFDRAIEITVTGKN